MKKENLKSNDSTLNTLKTRYRLPETTTPEDLGCNWSTVLNFGNHVLLAGYYYAGPNKNNYFGAIFTFTTADHTCEGEIKLEKISTEMYPDNGSAIAWCIGNCH